MISNTDIDNLLVSVILLFETFIEESPTAVAKESFCDDLFEYIVINIGEEYITTSYVEFLCTTYIFDKIYPSRSSKPQEIDAEEMDAEEMDLKREVTQQKDFNLLTTKINALSEIPQPSQRSEQWYDFRHNLITASNAFKMFGTNAVQNSLILEKCQPVKRFSGQTSLDSPLHHGQKYETMSVLYYEHVYQTTVSEFGCIQHSKYSFLGASPDGINTDSKSPKFGRMLEIKNVVSREITGIPKEAYWIQMQLQMETCDLDETDFLETKFTEYACAEDFFADGDSFVLTSDGKHKGIMLQFQQVKLCNEKDDDTDGVHQLQLFTNYSYKPFLVDSYEAYEKWKEIEIGKKTQQHGQIYELKVLYWKLETISCVLVKRNRQWFMSNIDYMKHFWNIIVEERTTGYQHRLPKPRIKKQNDDEKESANENQSLLSDIVF